MNSNQPKNDGRLEQWIMDALKSHGGIATIVEICKHIWQNHELELRQSGDGFYTWQYDMRWAGKRLNIKEDLQLKIPGKRGSWRLAD